MLNFKLFKRIESAIGKIDSEESIQTETFDRNRKPFRITDYHELRKLDRFVIVKKHRT